MSEIKNRADFSFVRYAQCWEDADVLLEALAVQPGGHYLSIASGGENSFSILARGGRVTAVDLSRIQLAVTDLKRAAYATLEYEPFLAFLGVRPSDTRLQQYQKLRPLLAPQHQALLDAQQPALAQGVIHSGKFERYFRLFRRRVLPLTHRRGTIRALAEFHGDRTAREQFYTQRWENAPYRALFRIFFSRWLMGRLGRDAEFFRYVEGNVADRIRARVKMGLIETDPGDNPYLHYILTGNYGLALPHALRAENFQAIKDNLGKLTLREAPLEECLDEFADGSIAGYNLSDIFEYMTQAQMDALYALLLQKAQTGGRLAYWNMLVPRQANPERFGARVTGHRELGQALLKQDKAFFYSRLIVEEVR